MTLRALSSSPLSRSFSFLSPATYRSRSSPCCLPEGFESSAMAPRSRCLRHSFSKEEYRPSRRKSAPLSPFPSRSYSARIVALYVAEKRRAGRAIDDLWVRVHVVHRASLGARVVCVVDRRSHSGEPLPALSVQ
jgi:hypothetical protein